MKGMDKLLSCVVMVTLLITVLLTSGCVEDDTSGTPEALMSSFVESINNKDGELFMELLVDNEFLSDDVFEEIPMEEEEFKEYLEDMKSAIDDGEAYVESYEIEELIYLEDMEEDNRTQSEEIMEMLNDSEYFQGDISDMCTIILDWDATVDEDSPIYWVADLGDFDDLFLLEIEGKWYNPMPGTAISAVLYTEIDG